MEVDVTRNDAINMVLINEIKKLEADERFSLLLDWWSIDSEDHEYYRLPESLREELSNTEEPVKNPMSEKYVPLLMVALRARLRGVTNEWLRKRVFELTGAFVEVQGICEVLERCPCCGYRTLLERGEYEVCRVCFWEDDGIEDVKHYSNPNHMTLADGRVSFEKYGAIAEQFQKYVSTDAHEKFKHDES